MARSLTSVLIIGGTGTIGTHITLAFAKVTSKFRRVALFTSADTAEKKRPFFNTIKQEHGFELIVGDLGNTADVKAAFEQFDCIVSALGRNVLHLQPGLADILASLPKLPNGFPRRFYPSEYGTDIKYDPETSPHEKPHQNKLKTRAHIEELARQGRIEYTYVVTGPFLDTFLISRASGFPGYNPEQCTYEIVGSEDESAQHVISGTTYKDTGKYVVSSILTPDASANATLRVSSINAKPQQIKRAIEKVTNKKLSLMYTSMADFRKKEEKAWADNLPSATAYTLTRIWYSGGSDFTKKPTALYLKDGQDVEDPAASSQLFKDVPARSTEEVVAELLDESRKPR